MASNSSSSEVEDPAALKRKIKRLELQIQDLNMAGDKLQQLKEVEEKVRGLENFKQATEVSDLVSFKMENAKEMRELIVNLRNRLAAGKGTVIVELDRLTGKVTSHLLFS